MQPYEPLTKLPRPQTEPPESPPESLPEASLEPQGAGLRVLVVRGAAQLAPFVAAWQELADGAAEPNVFYEPWMLLPALEAFADGSEKADGSKKAPEPEFHLIFAPGRGPESAKPQLLGLFPLVREKRYKGVRTTVLRTWKHLYCPLCTPLLKHGYEVEVLVALLDSLAAQKRGASLLELQHVSGDGPFGRALVEVFCERGTTTFVDESWTRAVIRPQPDKSGEDYLQSVMTGKRRKELRRQENRLADEGAVSFTELRHETDPDTALQAYIEDFLRLESSGWKGEIGSDFASDPAHLKFFRAITAQAHQRKRLVLSMLRVDGVAIAAKCDLLAGTGAFAFKIGFDEAYARFSPGVLLEVECIRQIHQNAELHWMDSCAVRNHPMINRLWSERRTLQSMVIATGRGRGEFVVAGLSLLRHFKRAARRKNRRAAKPRPENT